ncbi:MAG: hypothetical protein V4524_03485 [Patescibacteria group bacterium]
MNNPLDDLFVLVVFVLIVSFATGLLFGGPDMGKKVITWELKQLAKFGRWMLKHFFQLLANIFQRLAKECGPTKKKP